MKKSNNSKTKIQKKKINKEEIKEELKKLKVKLPEQKKPEEKKEDSELEEEIEETENAIEDTEFHEFFQPQERTAGRGFTSLLSKIETPSEKLEENIASTPIEKKEETPNLQSYAQSQDYSQGEAKKYESETSVSLRRTEARQRELPKHELRSQFQQQSNDAWRNWDNQIDVQAIEESRALPFEKEEKKYKEFKPR